MFNAEKRSLKKAGEKLDMNRPLFAGGSKVSMDGWSLWKKVTE
jgi:hypothetical protein|tara:strand:- start:36 stop:164 length:129 start_codon:yes stop_codon:yes gene_type:complete